MRRRPDDFDRDPFVGESERVRWMVAPSLRAWWAELPHDSTLEIFEPAAPLAPMGRIRGRDGSPLVEFSAHAESCSLLIGREGHLCSFDEGTREQRVERLVGAVAAIVSRADTEPKLPGSDDP